MKLRAPVSAVGAAAALAAAPASALASGPSAAQIRAAVGKAERSNELWATINICNTRRHPRQLGVRGQMPSLGFRSQMYMTFDVTYRSSAHGAFKPVPKTKNKVMAGQASHKLIQDGRTYSFNPSSALLAGMVTFTWWRDGKVLGRTTLKTTGGHRHVDFADPPGFSAATCKIT
jgi:hypothetical protein